MKDFVKNPLYTIPITFVEMLATDTSRKIAHHILPIREKNFHLIILTKFVYFFHATRVGSSKSCT